MNEVMVTVEEGQRQMILLALGELAKARPGWDYALGEIAKQFSGFEMFEAFRDMERRYKTEAVERTIDAGLDKKL